MTTQFDPNDPTRFEEMYRDERLSHGLPAATPWDIGGPQPVTVYLSKGTEVVAHQTVGGMSLFHFDVPAGNCVVASISTRAQWSRCCVRVDGPSSRRVHMSVALLPPG